MPLFITTIPIEKLEATGSLTSSTYLRGDGTWSTIAGGGDFFKDGSVAMTGALDLGGNNIVDVADVTFRTGASGGTLRTGTSAADKFTLQAYDVNDTQYRTVIELDAGNTVVLQLRADYLEIDDDADTTKRVTWDISGATTGTATGLVFAQTAARTITFPDASGTIELEGHTHTESDITDYDPASATMARVSGSTYSTIQHMQDIFHSSGNSSGGVISDAGSGNITATGGTGFIRATDSAVAQLLYFDYGALGSTAIPSNTTRYVGVEYNAGSPQIVVRTTYNWNFNTDYPLGTVVNEGGTLHISLTPHSVGDHASLMIQRSWATMPLQRDARNGGLTLGESGTRNITVSAGTIWDGLGAFPITALDTSVTGSFDIYYRDGAGGWTLTTGTQWPNTAYDDNSGTPATMTNNRYANLWFYVDIEDSVVMIYGQGEYTSLALAENEAPPTPPTRVLVQCKLIGRLLFQKSDATAQQIQSAFDATFANAGVTDHGNLAGLTDDDHTQYLLAAGTRGLSANWDAGSYKITAQQLESDVATGTAPLVVASTTLVSNLNADLLDGQEASAFAAASHNHSAANITSGTLAAARGGTSLGAPSQGDMMIGSGLSTWTGLAIGTAREVLRSNGTTATWQPTIPTGTTGPSSPQSGDTYYDTNDEEEYKYDATRSKWLGSAFAVMLGNLGTVNPGYLRVGNNTHTSSIGFTIPFDLTLVGITFNNSNSVSTVVDVDQGSTTVASLTVTTADNAYDATVNADFTAGQELKVYINTASSGTPQNVTAMLIFKRRAP